MKIRIEGRDAKNITKIQIDRNILTGSIAEGVAAVVAEAERALMSSHGHKPFNYDIFVRE